MAPSVARRSREREHYSVRSGSSESGDSAAGIEGDQGHGAVGGPEKQRPGGKRSTTRLEATSGRDNGLAPANRTDALEMFQRQHDPGERSSERQDGARQYIIWAEKGWDASASVGFPARLDRSGLTVK